jgi:hypothetical protein
MQMKKVAIVQSNYIPWKGYFDLIAAVDEFILYDDAQYTRRDWRNRNRIKTPQGPMWLSVPVKVKGKFHQRIRDTEILDDDWADRHWKSLLSNYRHAGCFAEVAPVFEPLYRGKRYTHLSVLNRDLIEAVCRLLGIPTKLSNSWDYSFAGTPSERLAQMCRQAGGDLYISGPSAKAYLDETAFSERGIALSWFDYSGYPEYPQPWGGFLHDVSVLDLLFSCGCNAAKYMKHVLR